MMEFFDALFRYSFIQYALLTGVLASIACGVVGSLVVVRRITYIAGAIAHSVLGGMGAARYLQVVHGITWISPLSGALIASLVAALIIGIVSIKLKEREDTIIGAIWAAGMAIGIIFITKTPGYGEDLMSYLFGNILMVTPNDLKLIAALDGFVILVGLIFYNQLLAICFDEEFARLRGLKVELYYLLLLCLTALTVVLLVTVVGIVLVIALITLPVAVAGIFSKRLWQMMILSALLSSIFTATGLMISYSPNLPSGAAIIMVASIAYILSLVATRSVKYLKSKSSR